MASVGLAVAAWSEMDLPGRGDGVGLGHAGGPPRQAVVATGEGTEVARPIIAVAAAIPGELRAEVGADDDVDERQGRCTKVGEQPVGIVDGTPSVDEGVDHAEVVGLRNPAVERASHPSVVPGADAT